MPDARVTIDGTIAGDPRFNTTQNGSTVVNLRVLAGRSRKNDQGGWDTLSTTAYDVSLWNEHSQLADAFQPAKGDKVIVSGTITGLESYDGKNGVSLSAKVSADGLRVFKKQQGQGGYQQSQQGGFGGSRQGQGQQQSGWGQNPNQGQQSGGYQQQGFGTTQEPPF